MSKQLEQSSAEGAEETLPVKPRYQELCEVLKQGELIKEDPSSIPVRGFYGHDGSVFFGVILQELKDSFLVGSPAKLMMTKDRQVVIDAVSAEPVIRVFKAATRYVVTPIEFTQFHYYTHLENFGYKFMSEYFSEEMRKHVTEVLSNPKFTNSTVPKVDKVEETSEEEDVLHSAGASYGAFLISNNSDCIH
jgi:hypothetical protein